MTDFVILKTLDENEDPLPGAWAWGGPAISEATGTPATITKHPLVWIDAESGVGQLLQDVGYDLRYITEAAETELLSLFGSIGSRT